MWESGRLRRTIDDIGWKFSQDKGIYCVMQGSPSWCPRAPGRPKGPCRSPAGPFKNNISINNIINAFSLTINMNTKVLEGKLSKIFTSEVCIKLVALRINWYTRNSSQFQKGWWPGADTGGVQGMHPLTRPKEVLTWHLISLKIIAKNIFVLHIT